MGSGGGSPLEAYLAQTEAYLAQVLPTLSAYRCALALLPFWLLAAFACWLLKGSAATCFFEENCRGCSKLGVLPCVACTVSGQRVAQACSTRKAPPRMLAHALVLRVLRSNCWCTPAPGTSSARSLPSKCWRCCAASPPWGSAWGYPRPSPAWPALPLLRLLSPKEGFCLSRGPSPSPTTESATVFQ